MRSIACVSLSSPLVIFYYLSYERKALSTLSQKSATVAENGDNGDSRRIRTFLRQCGQALTKS